MVQLILSLYLIESVKVEVAKASGEHCNNNCENLFLCHVCDVQSGCGGI